VPCSNDHKPLVPASCFLLAGWRIEAPQGSPSHDLDRAAKLTGYPSLSSPYVAMTLNYPKPLVITQRKRDAKKTSGRR